MKRMCWARIIAIIFAAGLAACASTAPEHLQSSFYQSFEHNHREKALALQQQRRWAEAAVEWDILVLLRPENAEYQTRLRDVKARIAKGVEEDMKSAEEARQGGDLQEASRSYLKALSLDPTNRAAIDALRKIQHEVHLRSLRD
jgi:tetratricopeptide (TPR) repeat protein